MARHCRFGSITEEYNRAADEYDQRWKRYTDETVQATLKRSQEYLDSVDGSSSSNNQTSSLDVGSGTGAFALSLQAHYPRWNVICSDPSERMLEQAQRKSVLLNSNKEDLVSFVVASSESLPFPRDSFHVVTSVSSFHFWTLAEQGLREVYRVMKPGGILVLSDFCHDFVSCQILAMLLWAKRYPHRTMYGVKQVQKLLQGAGFEVIFQDAYGLRLRLGRIGPRWGMMTLIARKPCYSLGGSASP
jgi:ubiquinone/menaquinone biosynthesis C-methylase UbiE